MSEPKSAAEVLEWLMETADLDTGFPTKDQAQAIWNLMRHPATTRLMLAVQAWERGENYAKVKTEADALKARLAAAEARASAAEAERDEAKRSGDQAFRGFQQVCFAMTGTSDVVSFMDALKPHSTAEAYAQDLRVRCAAAAVEAGRARGALVEVRRMIESDAYRASITARIDAHLASRPEHNKED